MNIATTQLWKINEQNSNKNGVHKTIYWVKSTKKLFSSKKDYKINHKYKGDWNDNKKSGFGVQIFPNGDKYEGEWENNKRHGKGTHWVLNQRNKLIREYTGKWENDKKNGPGTIFFDNGDRYDGFWVDNKMSGYGRLVYNSKDIYIGMWYNGRKNGYGFLTKNNGDHFEGNWVNDQREGFGSYFFKKDGKIIIGEWVDDSPKTAVYCNIKEDLENQDFFESRLKIPILELENPIEVISMHLQKVKINRMLFRIQKSPLHLLYQENELSELENYFNQVFERKANFNAEDAYEFFEELSFFSIEEVNATILELQFDKETLNLDQFAKTVYYLRKINEVMSPHN